MPAYFALALIATALALASRAAGHPLSLHPAGEVRAPVAHLIAHTRHLTERALTRRCRPQRAYRWARAYLIPVELRPGVLSFQRGELRRARGLAGRCASAIPAWPWLALASCESGRDWDYNGPSGFDGGFQFLPSTWTAAKGAVARARRYAYAWQAPAYVQYLVARDWLARTSWLQWPVCSARIGAR